MRVIAALAVILLFVSGASNAAQTSRPSHINEQFFEPLTETVYHNWRSRNSNRNCQGSAEVWNKILLGMGIEAPSPERRYYFNDCGPATAITILGQIRQQLGKNHPYQKIWAKNQQRVLGAKNDETEPPEKPDGETLPDRAMSDYEYQLASWHFYKRYYGKALSLYQKVAKELNAPMRPYAAYMVVRLFYYQDKAVKAEQQIRSILADDTLKAVHEMAANYRFVMLWQNRDVTYNAALMEDFLAGLLKVVAISPEKAADIERSLNDFTDAKLHLNHYFPLSHRDSKTVDWWLRGDVEVKSPRMQAVKAMAHKNETVDWLQSTWALNIFDADWLWALHVPEASYWKQNKHIVDHAWKRWQAGDGLEWLEIVLSRIHPNDPLALDALQAVEPYFMREWKIETRDYRSWLADVWGHVIRVHLGRKEYEKARKLIANHQDYVDLRHKGSYRRDHDYTETLENSLRWQVYVGEWDEARATLSVILKQYPKAFTRWRTLLATDWEEAMASAYTMRWSYGGSFASDSGLWQRMVNLLPAKELYALAQDEKIDVKARAMLANAALTRAMLLSNKNEIKQYAALAAKLNPELREHILTGVEGFEQDGYVDLMLRVPRLRLAPFTKLWQPNTKLALTAIDVFNHNDNNWWCRYDEEDMKQKLDTAAFVTLETNRRNYETHWLFRGIRHLIPDIVESVRASEIPYIEKQKQELAKHPFHVLVNEAELAKLETISAAPQYLSEAVIKSEKWKRWMIWRSEESKNESASDLHHAVRTTRYGCQRNGSHAAYSRAAFKILHQSYGDTVWAEATPYWYSCKHFRDGCKP